MYITPHELRSACPDSPAVLAAASLQLNPRTTIDEAAQSQVVGHRSNSSCSSTPRPRPSTKKPVQLNPTSSCWLYMPACHGSAVALTRHSMALRGAPRCRACGDSVAQCLASINPRIHESPSEWTPLIHSRHRACRPPPLSQPPRAQTRVMQGIAGLRPPPAH
jgi:hypothetical protein